MSTYNKPQIQFLNKDNLVYRDKPYTLQFKITRPTLADNIIEDNNFTDKTLIDKSNEFTYKINKQDWTFSNTKVDIFNLEIADEDILKITGKKLLPFTYKIYFNDNLKKEVSVPVKDEEIIDSISILGSDFNDFVDGKVKIEVKYGYKEELIESQIYNLQLINTAPKVLVGDIVNNKLDLTIMDDENDKIQINIRLNGNNYFPRDGGFTDLVDTPYFFTTNFSGEVNVNPSDFVTLNNIVTITVRDQYGSESQLYKSFVGEFYGIMFLNEKGEFLSGDLNDYTNDKNILKELYLGNIKAGTKGEKRIVYLQNKTRNVLKNIQLKLNTVGIPEKTYVKISKSALTNFEDMTDTIDFSNQELQVNEKLSFYIQANTEVLSLGGGYGYIDVIADAIE